LVLQHARLLMGSSFLFPWTVTAGERVFERRGLVAGASSTP
jgi:hypothetical protein